LSCALTNMTARPQRARQSSKCIRGMKKWFSQSILIFTFISIFHSESFKDSIKSLLYVHNFLVLIKSNSFNEN